MNEIRTILLGGCDVVWNDAVVNSTGNAMDGRDALVFSVYAAAVDPETDKDSGAVVTGASAISMSYISGSNGKFIGHLPASASLVRDAYYWIEVTATPNGGSPHTRRSLVQAVDRGFNP